MTFHASLYFMASLLPPTLCHFVSPSNISILHGFPPSSYFMPLCQSIQHLYTSWLPSFLLLYATLSVHPTSLYFMASLLPPTLCHFVSPSNISILHGFPPSSYFMPLCQSIQHLYTSWLPSFLLLYATLSVHPTSLYFMASLLPPTLCHFVSPSNISIPHRFPPSSYFMPLCQSIQHLYPSSLPSFLLLYATLSVHPTSLSLIASLLPPTLCHFVSPSNISIPHRFPPSSYFMPLCQSIQHLYTSWLPSFLLLYATLSVHPTSLYFMASLLPPTLCHFVSPSNISIPHGFPPSSYFMPLCQSIQYLYPSWLPSFLLLYATLSVHPTSLSLMASLLPPTLCHFVSPSNISIPHRFPPSSYFMPLCQSIQYLYPSWLPSFLLLYATLSVHPTSLSLMASLLPPTLCHFVSPSNISISHRFPPSSYFMPLCQSIQHLYPSWLPSFLLLYATLSVHPISLSLMASLLPPTLCHFVSLSNISIPHGFPPSSYFMPLCQSIQYLYPSWLPSFLLLYATLSVHPISLSLMASLLPPTLCHFVSPSNISIPHRFPPSSYFMPLCQSIQHLFILFPLLRFPSIIPVVTSYSSISLLITPSKKGYLVLKITFTYENIFHNKILILTSGSHLKHHVSLSESGFRCSK